MKRTQMSLTCLQLLLGSLWNFSPSMAATPTFSTPATIGPRTPQQAEHLFKQIQSSLTQGDWKTLASKSVMWINRYPAHEHAPAVYRARSEALRALGQSKAWIQALSEEKALFPNQIPNDEPILAQLSAGNWTEAKLLLSQLPESRRKLLLQTRLDTEEGRLSEAATTLMLARAKPLGSTLADRATESEAWELEHRLKLLTCGRLPSDTPIEEGLLRDQLDRKSLCLHEAFQLVQKLKQSIPSDASPLYRDEIKARIATQTNAQMQADSHWKRDCQNPFHYLPSFKAGRSTLSAFEQAQVRRFFEPICSKFQEQRTLITTASPAQGAGLHVEPHPSH